MRNKPLILILLGAAMCIVGAAPDGAKTTTNVVSRIGFDTSRKRRKK